MSTALPAPERRRRVRAMLDEDDHAVPSTAPGLRDGLEGGALKRTKQAGRTLRRDSRAAGQPPPTPPSSSRRRTSSASSSAAAVPTTSSSSPKLLVKLNGRVYRQPEEGDLRSRAHFEADLLLNEPSETVEDLELERRQEKRRRVEQEMKRERMLEAQASPSAKGKGRVLMFDSDDEDEGLRVEGMKGALGSSPFGTPTKSRSGSTFARPSTPPPRPAPTAESPASPSPSLGLPFAFQSPRSASRAAKTPLPPPLAGLLSLHSAVERSLILHLSTAGSSVASSTSEVDGESGQAVVRMTNLIDLPQLSRMLESTGKRFGEDELRRLVWLWEGCGGLVAEGGRRNEDEAGGMGFVVTRARTSSAAGACISGTYGVGISVVVKTNPQLPKFELVSPGRRKEQVTPPSPSSVGKGREGMSIVALWTQGKEQRQVEVERRLRLWAKETGVKKEDGEEQTDDTLTFDWTVSASSQPSVLLANIPRASLPLLNAAVPAIPSTSTPSPKKPSTAAQISLSSLPVASPEKFASALLAGKPIKAKGGKAADRAAALRERIQAKQDAQKQSAYHASLSALFSGDSPTKRSLKRHAGDLDSADATAEPAVVSRADLLKRNAMLSRLGSIADVVAMRCTGRPTRFEEVCTAIANSPLLAIGFDEADQSLAFLSAHFPNFCYIKLVGVERWLYLRGVEKPLDVKERVKAELARVAEQMKLE
ncbi:hypothetical protein JCM6882_004270 [Rhodosporidiobolus microsporus]